jgi:predicted nuclease of predicted toxin-antitoxin system
MKFLLNENITPRIKDFFSQRGYQCMDIYEAGLSGKTDEQVIEFAISNKLIVLTHDLDYGRIISLSGKQFPSVITLRHKKISLEIIQHSLDQVLPAYSDQLISGILLSIDEESIRTRKLPFLRD